MYSRRQLKMGSVIQEAFADILTRDGKSIYGKAFVTITNAKVTPDLSLVRFYLSVFNADDADAVIDKFNERKFELKKKLAEKLRSQMRVMPQIEFFRDETLDYAFHMDEVFKKIREDEETLKAEIQATESRRKKADAKAKKKPARKKAVSKKAKK
jgi:ribosome-binding factor A